MAFATTSASGQQSQAIDKDAAPSPSIFHTKVLSINLDDLSSADSQSSINLQTAIQQLRSGNIIAFPTETVYGLGADATCSAAVQRIYAAKQRPVDNPLIVHFASLEQLRTLLGGPIPKIYESLIERFWPGPLTIILPLPSPSPLAPEVTHSLRTFGARMPSLPLALTLIQQSGLPLAAPSANASGRPSPTKAQHVIEDLNGRISLILDGGSCDVGVESTVVDGLCEPPCILRPGGVSMDEIRQCRGWESVVNAYASSEQNTQAPSGVNMHVSLPTSSGDNDAAIGPRAPGMKYRHYAPRAPVILVDAQAWHRLDELIVDARKKGHVKIGVLRTRSPESTGNGWDQNGENGGQIEEICIGPTVKAMAHGLFAAFRELDYRGVDVIYVEGLSVRTEGRTSAEKDANDEDGEAVMNRIRKAAGERIMV